MKFFSTMLFCSLTLPAVACQSAGYDKKTEGDEKKAQASTAVVSGTIGNEPWQLKNAFAYKDPDDAGRIVVDLFDQYAPKGCEIDENGNIGHVYDDPSAAKSADMISLSLPSSLDSLPWKGAASDVTISDADDDGTSLSGPAKSGSVTITAKNESTISGTLEASAKHSTIAGRFTAKFCDRAN